MWRRRDPDPDPRGLMARALPARRRWVTGLANGLASGMVIACVGHSMITPARGMPAWAMAGGGSAADSAPAQAPVSTRLPGSAPRAGAAAQAWPKAMEGLWVIAMPEWPEGPGRCEAYLPPGTRLQVQVLGPNRLALEEGRANERGGLLTVMPAWPQGFCQTALGRQMAGGEACANEAAARQQSWRLDVDLSAERLDAKAMAEVDQAFLREQGARAGAHTALMTVKQTAVAWRLWWRHPDEMVAQCVNSGADGEVQSVPMRWKRLPAGR